MYQLEVDYATQGPRTFFATVNNGTPIELDLNGSTFSDPQPIVIPVQLHAGVNTISFGNPNAGGFAPGLDSITVAPIVGNPELSAAVTSKAGPAGLRLCRLRWPMKRLGRDTDDAEQLHDCSQYGQPRLQGKRSAADAASGRTDRSFIDTLG